MGRWTSSSLSQASRLTTSNHRLTDLSSLMGMASLCWHLADCATSAVPLVTHQVLAQLDLLKNWKENKGYKNQVYLLPKELDEKVARLHLPALGANLTTLSQEQADYIGMKVEGPYKPDTYRY